MNHQQVSTFLTAANVKFMLLHGGKGEEVVKNFFNEVYGYYVKVCPPFILMGHDLIAFLRCLIVIFDFISFSYQ